MSDHALPTRDPGTLSRLGAALRALRPAEGPVVVLLHLVMLLAAAWSVVASEWVDGLQALPIIVVAGALIGLLLAKALAPDLASHLIAFWLGVFIVVMHVVIQFPALGDTIPARLRELASLFERWTISTVEGDRMDDSYLFAILLGLTGWLVAYMSAWTLYRRNWVTASILLPGAVLLINTGYRDEAGATPLVLYLVSAGALVVAHFAWRRRWDWSQRGLQTPPFISSRIVGIGFNAVLLVTILAWVLPFQVRDDLLARTWQAAERPIEAAQGQIDDLVGQLTGDGRNRAGSYADFQDSFDLGGELDLSADPIVAFDPDTGAAPYLAARRMDAWDGHGWRSTADDTFREGDEGDGYSSRITYAPEQPVALSGEVTNDRVPTGGDVRVLAAGGSQLFTRDTYVTTDQEASVQLSWQRLDEAALSIATEADRAALPLDLRPLAEMLADASFATDGEDVEPDDARLAQEVEGERDALFERLVSSSWVVEDGTATRLVVSGPIPVYDDVEAVDAQEPLAVNDTYSVQGLASVASEDQLRGAGSDYPDYVASRYLPLPTTTTDETRALALQVVTEAGATNPFDMAIAIQDDLRARITYTESPPDPPSNRDAVDFVLFETQQGYCEYYASAMAVMLRTQGIPARVVTGFFPPDFDPENGYVYREENAHVWVEAFFPGYGWIPFEPTSNRTPPDYSGQAEPPALPSDSPSPSPAVTETPVASDEPVASPTQPAPQSTAPSPSPDAVPPATTDPASGDSGISSRALWVAGVIGAVLLVVALVALWLVARWRRGLRGLSPVSALYARSVQTARWLRVADDPTMTPAEYADRLGRAIPGAAQPARTVVEQYTREQYAPASDAPSLAAGQRAWRDLRRAVIRAIPRRLLPGRRR